MTKSGLVHWQWPSDLHEQKHLGLDFFLDSPHVKLCQVGGIGLEELRANDTVIC